MNMPGMSHHGMHGAGGMAMPKNSIAMMGGPGPYGTIDMGGMLAVFKVRENMTSYADPGWYEAPPGTVAQLATQQELQRDGIAVAAPASQPGATVNKLGTNHKNMPGMKH